MSTSSVEHSPSESPLLGPTRPRRLSARRGSVTAADPWGEHAYVNLNPARSTSSRLTIVRVPPQPDPEEGRRHRRHGSNASIGSTSSKGESAGRLSFAFTSFAPSGSNSGRSSPPSPRIRPTTPGSPHRQTVSLPIQHARLTPEQLVDLARSSCNPRASSAVQPSGTGGPSTAPVPAPVSFTPLPDSIYLPFIDRPSEVSSLLSSLPTSKLIALLAQTFPSNSMTVTSSSPPPSSSASSVSSVSIASTTAPPLESDPKTWSFGQLAAWLRTVDRDAADDVTWIRKARACVLEHSELIWERLKGALGVPPELNVDDDELPFHIQFRERLKRHQLEELDNEGTSALDSAVFEPDSPIFPVVIAESPASQDPLPESTTEDAVTVSPVLASNTPLPANTTSLQEVREEEEENVEENSESDQPKGGDDTGREVHGLRFSTSPSAPIVQSSGGSSIRGERSSSFGSSSSGPTFALEEAVDDRTYDPTVERGPGRPLFPSSFAHLGMGPPLRPHRAQSLSYTSPSSSTLRRAGSLGIPRSHAIPIAGVSGVRSARWVGMADWKTASNEYAVSTGSTSGVE